MNTSRTPYTPEQRKACREAYEGGEGIKTIARRLVIEPNTLRAWRAAEGWIPPIKEPVQPPLVEEIRAKVVDLSTRRAVEAMQASGAVDKQADRIAESLAMHGDLSVELQGYALDMVRRARRGEIQPGYGKNEADVMSAVVAGAVKAIEAARVIGGLKLGQLSARAHEDDGRRRFLFEAVRDDGKQAATG